MYSNTEKIIMWLSSFDFMSYKKAKFIVDNIENLETFFINPNSYKAMLTKNLFSLDEFNEMSSSNNFVYINRVIEDYKKLGIVVITIKSGSYPELLKEITSPPIMLYCKGNIDLLKTDCLGVVGTRRATKYGKDYCAKIIKDVASSGITIVSGLAEGIDTIGHKSCLEVNGKTIAVLGSGLLNIYPSSNLSLAKDIIDNGGLIISEYKPNEQALTFHFPIRNRIIAGLCKAIAIMEATENSGTMHTKNYALDFNREVFALPGRANDIYSVGCNKIIACGQARMLLEANDIIDFYGKNCVYSKETKVHQLSSDEQVIYNCLVGHEKHFEEILKETGVEVRVLSTLLMRMTISKVIEKLPGNYYKLVD